MTRPYFQRSAPDRRDQGGRYAAADAARVNTTSYEWNHGIGEIVTALLGHGLQITGLVEHDTVPWVALPGMMIDVGGEFCLADQPERLAASFTLQARKPG
ncbi:MAG TPA: hypothetical protein VES03_00845 [Motilibacterales bacterium]|nr:hypothetical protein [Motilibacterales bacterium]